MNGHANGSVHATPAAKRVSRSKRKNKGTFIGWTINKSAKLAVWALLYTIVFRCPASPKGLTDSKQDAYVCTPYFRARDLISPYAAPYYDQYLAPHVETVQPYVDRVNKHVYRPAVALYNAHGAPRVADAQKFGHQQWEKTVRPHLDTLSHEAEKQYAANLAPHVQKAQAVVQPHYAAARQNAADLWQARLQPAYEKAAPVAQDLASRGQQFAVETALPQARVAGDHALDFWNRRVWPKLRVLYGENVEPQLLRITERLGRYRDGKKLQAEIKSIETSTKLAKASSSASSVAATVSSIASKHAGSPASVIEEIVSSATAEAKVDPKVQFQEDLKSWKVVADTAVDEGVEDLLERINELAASQIKSRAQGVGSAMVVQLEEIFQTAVSDVQAHTLKLIKALPEDPSDEVLKLAEEDLLTTLRAAGQKVKEKALAIRDWKTTYDAETSELVEKALQSTLETIDHIRELRLTEIGRKYASTSLPHKEWAKYNDLKKASQDWHASVSSAAHAHPGLASATLAGEQVEESGMAVAEGAVNELMRLRDVAKSKIDAEDASDDFSPMWVPPVAKRVQKKLAAQAAAAAEAAAAALRLQEASQQEQGLYESVTASAASAAAALSSGASEAVFGTESGLSDTATDIASSLSSAVLGTPSGLSDSATDAASAASSAIVDKASAISEGAAGVASQVSAAVIGTESNLSDSATDVASKISAAVIGTESNLSDTATDVASKISAAVVGSEKPVVERLSSSAASVASSIASVSSETVNPSLASVISEQSVNAKKATETVASAASVAYESVSSVVLGSPEPISVQVQQSAASVADDVGSAASDAYESVQSVGAKASKKVFAGAMAEIIVESRDPILDDGTEPTVSPALDAVASEASSHYAAAVKAAAKQYAQAKSDVSAQVTDSPSPIHEQLFASAESAYSNAVAAANEKLQSVFGTTSQGYYESITSAIAAAIARPTPTGFEGVSAIASSRLSEGLSLASAQYQSAKVAVGLEPAPLHQQYLATAQRAYYEGIGLAHDQYTQFLAAASSALGATPTPTGVSGFLAAAQATYSSAVADAAAALESLRASAVSAAGARRAPDDSIFADLQHQYDVAVAAASASLAAASESASALFYGTSTGVVESASSALSEAVYGTEPSWSESLASQAAENWEALISRASEQVYGTPPPFTQAV